MGDNKTSKIEVRVAAADTEFQGTISNPRVFEWFSRGRIKYFREHGGMEIGDDDIPRIDGEKMSAFLVNINCDFRNPATFNDLLELTTRIGEVGDHTVVFEHELRNLSRDGALVSKADATEIFLDPGTEEKAPVPDTVRDIYKD